MKAPKTKWKDVKLLNGSNMTINFERVDGISRGPDGNSVLLVGNERMKVLEKVEDLREFVGLPRDAGDDKEVKVLHG